MNSPRRVSKMRRGLLIVGLIIIAAGLVPAWWQASFSYNMSAGRKALAAGEFEKSRVYFKRCERLRKKDPETQYRLAVVCRRTGKLEELYYHLNKAKELGWNPDDIYRQQLLLKAQVGRFQEVSQEMQALFEQDVSDEAALEVYEALAYGYWSDHQIQEAMKCLNYWIRWRKEDIVPRLMRAEIYNEFNDPKSAETEYKDVLKFAPENNDAHNALGQLLLKGGRVDEATKEFQFCLDHDMKTAEVYFGLAECEFRSTRPDEAEACLKQVNLEELSLERRAKVLKLQADIAQFRGDHQAVVKLLTKVLETWPHDVGVHQTLIQSYKALGQIELAEKHLALSRDISTRAEK
jgi:Tfp pilus assembly protein PilF